MLAILVALLSPVSHAQETTLGWQGRLTDTAGTPLDSAHDLTFTLEDDTGAQLWSKTYADVSFSNGYASQAFGGLDDSNPARPLDPAWLLAETWMELAVDGQTLGVSQRLQSVAQAAATVGAVQLTAAPECAATTEGALRWTGTALQTCNGTTWVSTGSGGGSVGTQATGDGSTSATPGHSCQTILDTYGATADQAYWIDPDGQGGQAPFLVHCDMTGGGGWTRILDITGGTSQWTGTARTTLWSDGANLSGSATLPFSQLTSGEKGFVGWARLAGFMGRTVEMRVQGTNELGVAVDETYTLLDFEVDPYDRFTEIGGMPNGGRWTVAVAGDADTRNGWGVCGTSIAANNHVGLGLCPNGFSAANPSSNDVQLWHYGGWSQCPNLGFGEPGGPVNYTYTCNRGSASVIVSIR